MKRIAMVVLFAFFASSKGGKAVLCTQFFVQVFLGHRLGDDLVDWNSCVSVRPYVHKKFFRFPSNLVCG